MQNDYATQQKDALAGRGANSSNYYQVNADSYPVNADENQLNADKNQYIAYLTPVQRDIQAIQQDWV